MANADAVPADSNAAQRKIVAVFSYHPCLEWTDALLMGLVEGLEARSDIEFDTEFLDAKRHPSLDHASAFIEVLRSKYAEDPPDVLMIADDPAFELLRDRVPELFPGVPVVFFGLNDVRDDLPPSFTGVYEIHQTRPTLDIALELTGARGVVVVTDTTETGQANETTLDELRAARPDIEWRIFRDLPDSELHRLDELPDDWPVFPMLPLREGHADGPSMSQAKTVQLLRTRLPNALFYDAAYLLGHGIVGGYALPGGLHAQQALDVALQILDGADPRTIAPSVDTPHRWLFDGRELERFGWSDSVPEGAEVFHRSPTFLEAHGEIIRPLVLGLLVLLGVILTLGWYLRSERRHAQLLRAEKRRSATALLAANAGVFEIKKGGAAQISGRWLEMFGLTRENISSKWTDHVTPESAADLQERVRLLREGSESERVEITTIQPRRLLDVTLTLDGSDLETAGVVGIGRDITEQRRFEQHAATRQRLNALGQLAGGVAHDFNNFLTVINGSAQVIQMDESTEPEIVEIAGEILSAGQRATALVRQLLKFGRRDGLSPSKSANLNKFVRELHNILVRLAGEECDVVLSLDEHELLCVVGATQVDQILTNLVVNARDAMLSGGTITIETELEHESHVVLRVRDEGVGMDVETLNRLFEPFYSTKRPSRGTGLGLSTVYGLVSATGGLIEVHSTVGEGSTFEVRWPFEPGYDAESGDEAESGNPTSIPLASA